MSFSLYEKPLTSGGTRFIDGKWVTQTKSAPAIVPKANPQGIALLGQADALPYKSELANINTNTNRVYYDNAARVIIVNPHPNLLQSIFSKDLPGEIVIILTHNIHLSNIPNHINIFAINQETPGRAAVLTINNITHVSGKIAITLLYSLLFDPTKNSNIIFHYRMIYSCPTVLTNDSWKPEYKNTKNIRQLVKLDESLKINLTHSTLICACHFVNKNYITTVIDRCNKLANALDHKNIIYVFSLSSEMQGELDYINSLSNDNVFFIQDVMNTAIDAGKYLLALNSISIDDIYSNNGVVTLFNDSVLMSNDLTRFSHEYKNAIKLHDIIGCTSSMQKSYHTQSWFTSYVNHNAIKDFIQLLSITSIDITNNISIRQSIIDQMEVGISAFLAVKYKTNVLYPTHNLYCSGSLMHDPSIIAKNIRVTLHICGFPFVKKKLIAEYGQASVGFNYHNFL